MALGEINFALTFAYSCQRCGKVFEWFNELKIIPELAPLCSSDCKYKVIYAFLEKYDNNTLNLLYSQCLPKAKPKNSRELTIFALCKFFAVNEVLTIKPLAHGSYMLELAQNHESAHGSGSSVSLGNGELSRWTEPEELI